MKKSSHFFLSSLLFISPFGFSAPSSPNANLEKQIDAKQYSLQAEKNTGILVLKTQSAPFALYDVISSDMFELLMKIGGK